jgi:hypothetical protein
MAKKQKDNSIRSNTTRHYVRVVAVVVFGMCLGALLMKLAYPYLTVERAPELKVEVGEVVSENTRGLPRALPTVLRIPTLGINARFESPLVLNAEGEISVPKAFDTVGWYQGGASPGEKGTASILGHVDSYEGSAIFFSLGQLTPGDRVYVDRADGSTAEFEVEYFERYEQADFPTEKVYGMTDYPSLRLITCSGVYDKGVRRYSHNTVVYARLVEGVAE